jgi:hypothetical protein
MSLVKVWTEVDDGKCYSLPAKIVSKKGNVFTIKYLSATDKKTQNGKKIYMYEDEHYEVTDDSITEYLESESELDLGFEQVSADGGFVKYESDSDDDYVPSEEEDDSESDDSDEDEDASIENEEDDAFSSGCDDYDD